MIGSILYVRFDIEAVEKKYDTGAYGRACYQAVFEHAPANLLNGCCVYMVDSEATLNGSENVCIIGLEAPETQLQLIREALSKSQAFRSVAAGNPLVLTSGESELLVSDGVFTEGGSRLTGWAKAAFNASKTGNPAKTRTEHTLPQAGQPITTDYTQCNCIKCGEGATRSDLYLIRQYGSLKGAAEIGICNECIRPYMPHKTGNLIGAIFIGILILSLSILMLSGESSNFAFKWWHLIMLFGAGYQGHEWLTAYTKNRNITTCDANVLLKSLANLFEHIRQIDKKVIINWQALKEKQKAGPVTISNFETPGFLVSVRTPLSLDIPSEYVQRPITLELIPDIEDFDIPQSLFYKDKALSDDDMALLKASVRIFRQEKINAYKAKYRNT
jgi:hypothetical protein